MKKFIKEYCEIKDGERRCQLFIEGKCNLTPELNYLNVQTDQGTIAAGETRLLEFLGLCNRCGWTLTIMTEFDYVQGIPDRVGRFHISVHDIDEEDLSSLQRYREDIQVIATLGARGVPRSDR